MRSAAVALLAAGVEVAVFWEPEYCPDCRAGALPNARERKLFHREEKMPRAERSHVSY